MLAIVRSDAVDVAVALLGAVGPARALASSLLDPAAYERAYRERELARGAARSLRRAGVGCGLMAALFAYAFARSGLALLWGFAALLTGLAAATGLPASYSAYSRFYEYRGPLPSETPDAELRRARRRTQATQVLYLAIWSYGWISARLAG